MADERLTGSEKRALVLWVLVGIVAVVFARLYFFQAFPEASVDLRISRGEALARAQQFIAGLGKDVSGYRSAIVFDVDDNAKTYLEREVGLQQANRLMSSELNIWYWNARFFRPQQEEEFSVRVSPGGQIVGYSHTMEEARAGATLEREAALAQAQKFLTDKLRVKLADWDFLAEETTSKKLPNRMHWEFTWEKRGFRAKEAPYRQRVEVDGDEASGSTEFLKVPEEWERGFRKLRSSNDSLTTVFLVPYLLLLGAAVVLGIILWWKNQVTWGLAIKAGIVVLVLMFLQGLNDWPLWGESYNTTDSYGSFLAQRIALALLLALVTAVFTVAAITPAGEALYRVAQPGKLRLAKAFTLRGIRTKEFFSSAVVGLSMAAVHIGYLTVFYIIARHLGAWAPQELNYENSVSTAFPWIAGASIGVTAASSEEFLFRMFAIPFLHRYTRSRWIAVILPAFLWSFLHSNYPQEPAYARGIEIGIMGMLAGVVMLRWGILATVTWHYTVDASLVGLLLIRSSSLYLRVSGVLVGAAAALPLAYCAVCYLRRGSFEAVEDLANGAEPISDVSFHLPRAERAAAEKVRLYEAMSRGKMLLLAACLLVGVSVVWKVKVPRLGDYLKVSVDAKEAKAQADQILRQRGLKPAAYHTATVFVNATDPFANEFLRERIGVEGLNAIYSKEVPGALWRVRYFQDQQAEEYAVILKPDGSLHSIHHILAENAPGAALNKEEALAKAEKFLKDEKKLELTGWTLVEAEPSKRPKRIDYHLTWQQDAALDASNVPAADSGRHAHARFEMDILGDEPANYRTYIKIPEDWQRQHDESTLGRTTLSYGIPILFYVGFGVIALVLFFRNLRSEAAQAVRWKRVSLWASAAVAAFIVAFIAGSGVANLLNQYRTEIPFKVMILTVAIGFVVGAAFNACGYALIYGTAWFFGNRAFGKERVPAGAELPADYYRDALWIGICGSAAMLGLHRLLAAGSALWPTMHRTFLNPFGLGLDANLPGGLAFAQAITSALFWAGFIALVAAFVAAVAKPAWLRALLFVMGALSSTGSDWGNGADFAKQLLAEGILLAVIVFGIAKVIRFNILGCLLVVACGALVGGANQLLEQPNSFYRLNGYGVVALIVVLLAWPLCLWRLRAGRTTVARTAVE
ncbi:MAG TPA: CPBP family intramembrane glutamic endopeptidase [Candidatus Methylomirabilis sp.]|nr:CPBP family intramembrane glutamic endopeptidase [Candidatus Methylomirabilis sp.]